jgi:hypothetical protein
VEVSYLCLLVVALMAEACVLVLGIFQFVELVYGEGVCAPT